MGSELLPLVQPPRRSWAAALPLHRRWQQYMRGLLQGAVPHQAQAARQQQKQPPASSAAASPSGSLEERLLSADLHGCLLRVAEAAERRYHALQGIVVRDTQQVGAAPCLLRGWLLGWQGA